MAKKAYGLTVSLVDEKNDPILKEVNKVIDSFKGKSTHIGAELTIAPGHEYWWFQEFGTGQYFDAKKGGLTGAGAPLSGVMGTGSGAAPPGSRRLGGALKKSGEMKDRYAEEYKGTGYRYPIRPRHARILVFRQGGKLRFSYLVWHPGVKGFKPPDVGKTPFKRGLVRTLVWQTRKRIESAVIDRTQKLMSQGKLVTRDDIVAVVNLEMDRLVKQLRRNTPTASYRSLRNKATYHGGHLRDAWGFIPAT